jgi:peptide chain release factor 1
MVTGHDAWRKLAPEAGGHRFQRIPPTEKRGRVQSSTVTVAVLRSQAHGSVEIRPQDLVIETRKDSGPGGQHRNKTESAIRITHLPTGVTASAATKSQHRNRELAMAVLRARLEEHAQSKAASGANAQRRAQIGSGQRSDKIRTVAFQRGRVENHLSGRRMQIDRYVKGHVGEIQ